MAALAHLHMPADLCEHGHCLLALGREGALNLDEAHACARQRFLEKIQSIVIIEDLDGVRQGNDLLRPHLHLFLVDACLRGTICFHSREEFLVLIQRLGAVAEVVLHLRDLHAKRADPPEFLLDGLRHSGDLLLLGSHQLLVGLDGTRLGGHRLLLLREHLVLDRLQDARDIATLRGVLFALPGGKEGQQLLAIRVHNILARGQESLQHGRGSSLQEATRHALLNCSDGLVECGEVGAALGHVLVVDTLHRLAEGRGLSHGRLGSHALVLVGLELLLGLQFLLLGALNFRAELRNLQLGRLNAARKVAAGVLAIAHELPEELLGLLALLGDLRLHGLEHRHNFADRVGLHLGGCGT
mmetsp:Transcript_142445/g.455317  ORF Transcript_142445/g.455317 Transcript_142445/m.455317 type:complete len:356 (-) Transcript_142445:159-1226(-)